METPRFSAFDAIVYSLKTVFNNIRLFFLVFLTKLSLFFLFISTFGLFSLVMLKKIWDQQELFLNIFQCDSFKSCINGLKQLWAIVSSVLNQYVIIIALFAILFIFLGMGIYLGFIRLVLKLHDTGSSSVRLLFSSFRLVPKAIISTMLYGIMVGVGFLFFFIPGIYLMLRGMFFVFFIVDQNAGIIDSILRSFVITRDQMWQLFALVFIAPMMLYLGPAAIFMVPPLAVVALVYTYRKISL